MRPTIRQLLVFKTVVEQGSFRKSSKVLHTSQPALTNTVKALEEVIGIEVFNRTTRSVNLTAGGRILYERIDPILEDIDMAVISARNVAEGRGGQLRISYIDFAILGQLPAILEAYRHINPHVHLNINFARTLDQIELLEQNQIDIGFILDIDRPLPPEFCSHEISLEGLMAVVPRSHKLAGRKTIELVELKDEFVIGGDARWDRYTDLLNEQCISRGFKLKIEQKAYLRDEMLSMVMAGLGILIYPDCILNSGRFGLVAIPITDVPQLVRTCAIWRNDTTNPAMPSFLELVSKGKWKELITKSDQ